MSRTYEKKMENNLIRIQKYFTDCGILSRRAAEAAIEAGEVYVNGEKATIGQKIDVSSDIVKYRGRVIRPTYKEYSYYMLNKPRGFITSLSDEKGRKCVTELLGGVKERVYPVGRLDYNSEGLLLLTNDGEIANRLTHPKNMITKEYIVIVTGEITDETKKILTSTVYSDGQALKAKEVEVVNEGDKKSVIRFVMTEGKNREIRRICEAASINVCRLKRVSIGKLELGRLSMGRYRALTPDEVSYIKSL